MNPHYTVKTELKKRLKANGLTIKDLALTFDEAPMTTCQRLNAWLPWTERHTELADLLINHTEISISEI